MMDLTYFLCILCFYQIWLSQLNNKYMSHSQCIVPVPIPRVDLWLYNFHFKCQILNFK